MKDYYIAAQVTHILTLLLCCVWILQTKAQHPVYLRITQWHKITIKNFKKAYGDTMYIKQILM